MKRDARALLAAEFETPSASPTPDPLPGSTPDPLPKSHHGLIKVARSLKAADVPISEASEILSNLKSTVAFYSPDPVFKILKEQFKPNVEADLYDQVLNFVNTTTGKFWSRDVAIGLGISKPGPKRQVSLILREMVSKDILESADNRHDYFVNIDRSCDRIDYLGCEVEPLSLKFPLGLETRVEMFPKNIMVIAGSPNAGKSAMCLSIAEMNMESSEMPISYFSSEMGDIETRKRLLGFKRSLESWNWGIFERGDNFAHVIDPNGFNIIDYLQIHDKFYEIGGKIKSIHDRLENGIAIIAIQKKDKISDYGLGGLRSLEIPRVYVSLQQDYPGGTMKIIKAKNWVSKDPNGMQRSFKLCDGCHFVHTNEWDYAEGDKRKGMSETYPDF